MKKEMWGIFGILLFVSLGFVSAGWFDFLKPTGHVVSQLTCEGGDNSNPYKEGWVTLYNPDDSPNKSFNDFCSNSSVLTQYSCSGSDVVMTNITCSINCSSDICSQEGDNEDYMEEFSIGAGDSVILDNGQVLLVKSISSNLISIKIDDISLNNLYEKQISKLNGVLLRVSSIGNSKVILGILSEEKIPQESSINKNDNSQLNTNKTLISSNNLSEDEIFTQINVSENSSNLKSGAFFLDNNILFYSIIFGMILLFGIIVTIIYFVFNKK